VSKNHRSKTFGGNIIREGILLVTSFAVVFGSEFVAFAALGAI
jgi:hypothetical protein